MLDEPARVGELAFVAAVHLVRVEDPVRVHRHRRLQLVAEVDDQRFADAHFEQRPRHLRRPERFFEVGGPGAVGPGGELGLALDRHVHHLVAAGGDDVPLDRLGGDPVLARRAVDGEGGELGRCRRVAGLRVAAPARRPRRPPPPSAAPRRPWQPVDVDLPFAGADLVPGERAEERAAAERQEPAPVDPVPVHRPTSPRAVIS